MAYRHGVYTTEVPSNLVPPGWIESSLPVVVGTAPVHNLKTGTAVPVNEPRLISTFPEFVAQFGAPGNGESSHDYTLHEFARVYIGRYAVAPVVFINVFDPKKHVKEGVDESPDTPDVTAVKASDIIGGVDAQTGKHTGLALVDEVFPRFRLVPCQILAPGFSAEPDVALSIGAACVNISGHFRAIGIIDIPQTITRYSDVPAWLNTNNLTDENLLAFFGQPIFGSTSRDSAEGSDMSDKTEWGSTHLASVIAARDLENEGIPYWSPSNRRLLANGLAQGGLTLTLTPEEAAYLNGNGIVTGLNMVGGMVAWGDQTCAYPGVTDVTGASIPIRRMFNWIGTKLILTAWQFVSSPLRRRMIETVQDTFNIWLNGLAAREMILGGRVTFEYPENSTTDLMSGTVHFHVYVTPPTAAREIVFTLEYDPSYVEMLFSSAS